jgi:hypothetical protein
MAARSDRSTRTFAPRLARARRSWLELGDRELLDARLCDLELSIEDSPLCARVERLYFELESRGLRFRPHVWLSTSWFSPDGVPGIAIPFYLAHPRLRRLEELETGDVEGGDAKSAMQLLRHEAGHALGTAYQLHASKCWRDTFGRFSARYASDYAPRPFRREFVLHLDHWYAQSHAAEDFAETFAVWLDPRSKWRARYGDWPAISKLEYVERRMQSLAGVEPELVTRERCWPLAEIDLTLGEYFAKKRERYAARRPKLDRALKSALQPSDPARKSSPTRAIARLRREIERRARDASFEERYTLEQVVRTLVQRAHQLDLTVDARDPGARLDAILELGHVVMRSLRSGRHKLIR